MFSLDVNIQLNMTSHVPGGSDNLGRYLQPDDVDSYDSLTLGDDDITSCVRDCVAGEARVCYYHFVFEEYQVLNTACGNCPDNITDCFLPHCVTANGYPRAILTANRQIPGPGIQVCLRDRIVVDVTNAMPDRETTVHWHGIFMRGQPYMDGVPYVTQCSILEGQTFRYDFYANNAGTFLWHSHDGFQKMDGLAGNLVVRLAKSLDPNSHLYDYDLPSHVILIVDWYYMQFGNDVPGFQAHDRTQGADSFLIGGRGRNKKSSKGKKSPLSVYRVSRGKRYRFRIIGGLCSEFPIRIKFEGHKMLLIATDGNPVKPLMVDTVVLEAGMRVDVVLDASQLVSSYWIRVQGLAHCAFLDVQQLAVLQYEGTTEAEPSTLPIKLPYLPQNKVFIPHGNHNHPFHLHGYSFALIEMGVLKNGSTMESVVEELKTRNFSQSKFPPLLDTIGIPNQGYAVIRFKADNPGKCQE
ncbi:hypothetical protein ANN_19917 [Periplaneta americana]|uniref:Laccase n=1 Tax=Periplaneta americana TaxID=6978 RepID=A0ABQ8SBE6_PERAM|nr:hypothetical protein ANN_19917 [Periplaneta americana]